MMVKDPASGGRLSGCATSCGASLAASRRRHAAPTGRDARGARPDGQTARHRHPAARARAATSSATEPAAAARRRRRPPACAATPPRRDPVAAPPADVARLGGRSPGRLLLLAGVGTWLLWPATASASDADPTTPRRAGRRQEPTLRGPRPRAVASEPVRGARPRLTSRPTDPARPRGGRDARGDAGLRPGLLRPGHLGPRVDLRHAHPAVPGRERRLSSGYTGFWSTIESGDAPDIRADPETLTTSYTIEYVTTSGRTTTAAGPPAAPAAAATAT